MSFFTGSLRMMLRPCVRSWGGRIEWMAVHWWQYENFPDTPSQGPAAAVGTRAEASGNGAQPPLVPGQRTRLFGSVMDRLTLKSPNDTGRRTGQEPLVKHSIRIAEFRD